MRLFFMAVFAALVLSAIAVGSRLLWRYHYPETQKIMETPDRSQFRAEFAKYFMMFLVTVFLGIGLYRLVSVQHPPANLERPPSKADLQK
ncbi:MAG: hypothetical protein HQL76_16055 [Magnetococcales bacterium]|nr:hypothetical protein [Magnetococcales bacterium]